MSNTESSHAEAESNPKLRALVALVIFMGILIIAGMIVVGVTIANRLGKAGEGVGSAQTGFAVADIPVPAGCEILETRPDGGRLIVRFGSGGRCNQVLIIDLESGAVAGRLNFVPTE